MDSDLETSNQPEAKKQTQLKRSDALCRQSSRTLKIKGTLFAPLISSLYSDERTGSSSPSESLRFV